MKKIKVYLLLAVLASGIMSCKKALELKTDSTFDDDVTWSLPDKAGGVLNNAYANIPNLYDSYSGNNFLDAATDDAVSNNFGSAIATLGAGDLSAIDNPVGSWVNCYNQIRYVNLFLEKGLTNKINYDLTSVANDQAYKRKLKGEAFFLRAYWSFLLLQQYGGKTTNGEALGYPIATPILSDAESKNLNITRNTYAQCVQQILDDCDTAIQYLPSKYIGQDAITGSRYMGRADQQVCLALKARVGVYAASPAYQPDNITKITGMGQFTVVDPNAYQQKWLKAVTLAQDAINVIGNFSSLKASDFNKTSTPNDMIWRKNAVNNVMEQNQYPPLAFGRAITGPSQNLVDAFPAVNGYPITDSRSGYDSANPYANRDPRLSMDIYVNNDLFDGRSLEIFEGGLDSHSRFPNATRTGYYLKKWLSTKSDILNPEAPLNDYHWYGILRKTELYLNYAEAANEAYDPNIIPPGSTMSASTVIKNIRKAAGLTAATSDAYVTEVALSGKDNFRKLIQNERRLELAFENQRYFDMRRWVLPLNETIRGIKVTEDAPYVFSYQIINVEPRNFNDIKYYYLPLPYDELSKSPSLENNLGW
ncbi:RagB/SusD family nutrient uptake outer membrane protein [Pedobacter sp. SD-b]|uniref:RagB/SusD family nutrient uptake outer membrane protein n=1 Tax=Pedobacter segetis TaxID=2793069 RepID=A0ABS1BJC3_9SPHI|nr:RagB/SusD family nutrient uptake outer membrane protein [Pedobacter segetis]MBK0382851.1 RagB/SusD family nutrient uptake outer membrane protein [Pedobacter segetis]